MGPVSSAFDIVIFLTLWFVFKLRDVAHFQTIWFTYSIVSNLVGMHIIRTAKVPFVQSNAHKYVYASSILLILVGIVVPFTALGNAIGLVPIGAKYLFMIFVVTFLYCIIASLAKRVYIKDVYKRQADRRSRGVAARGGRLGRTPDPPRRGSTTGQDGSRSRRR